MQGWPSQASRADDIYDDVGAPEASKSMRILFVGMYYHPETAGVAPFSTDLCTYLAKQGHSVSAIVTHPHYPQWKVYHGYRGRAFTTEIHDGVRLIRVPTPIPAKPSSVRRIAYDTIYSWHALLAGIVTREKYDIVVATCSPLQAGVTGWLLAASRRKPFLFHLQDIIPDAAIAVGMLRNPAVIKSTRFLAKFVYRKATKVSAVGKGYIDLASDLGVPRDKFVFLPHWADIEAVRPLPRMNAFRAKIEAGEDEFVVLYVGNIGMKQGMETVVSAAKLLENEPHFRFVIVGDGNAYQAMIAHAKKVGVTNIQFIGVQPRAELPEILAAGDLLLVHLVRSVVEMIVPGKLMAYCSSGRPIVMAGDSKGEGARFVTEANAGTVVPPESPECLAQAIRELHADPTRCAQYGENARAYVEQFAKDKILHQAEELLMEMCRAGGRK